MQQAAVQARRMTSAALNSLRQEVALLERQRPAYRYRSLPRMQKEKN
jgi:hypothetical protein